MTESVVYCNVVTNLDEVNILWWGTLFIKMKSYLLEVFIRF